MPNERKIQILIADNHELVRCGLKTLLAGTEIKIVAEATTVQAALKIALEKDLDVALLDVRLPDGDGLTALGRIKLDRPELPVLMFSAYDNPASIARAIALGASGFLLKGCSRDELLHTIRIVADGESIWSKENSTRKSFAENATLCRHPRSLLERHRGRGVAAHGPRADQQADRPGDGRQREHGQGPREDRLAEAWRGGSHAGRVVGGQERSGVRRGLPRIAAISSEKAVKGKDRPTFQITPPVVACSRLWRNAREFTYCCGRIPAICD